MMKQSEMILAPITAHLGIAVHQKDFTDVPLVYMEAHVMQDMWWNQIVVLVSD